jgi:hypothetical protein
MPHAKQASKRKAVKKSVPVLGAAGFSLIAGGASAATAAPAAALPAMDMAPNQEVILGEEEISDVNLATFYVFDKERALPEGTVQLARGGCGGCRGCGGGGRGCGGGGFRGCGGGRGCGGCGGRGCGGGWGGCGGGWWGGGCTCCLSWGACRWC